MRWNKMGWRWSSWCGRFTITPSRVIPARFDLWDRTTSHTHVCRTPEVAQAVAAKLSGRGRP